MPADRKLTMSRKEKVIDALVDLSVALSAGSAASTKAGETAVVLERIVRGLPGASAGAGEMLARALKADPRTEDTPIWAITPYARTEDRNKAVAAGCDDYITKPFKMSELVTKLRAFVASSVKVG